MKVIKLKKEAQVDGMFNQNYNEQKIREFSAIVRNFSESLVDSKEHKPGVMSESLSDYEKKLIKIIENATMDLVNLQGDGPSTDFLDINKWDWKEPTEEEELEHDRKTMVQEKVSPTDYNSRPMNQ